MSTIVQGHVQTPAVDIRGSWTGTPEAPSIWKGASVPGRGDAVRLTAAGSRRIAPLELRS